MYVGSEDDKHSVFSESNCWVARYRLSVALYLQLVFVANLSTTLVGSAIGPHPFPTIVRDFQKVIGEEIQAQMQASRGKLP
jgi:hypothetical protein